MMKPISEMTDAEIKYQLLYFEGLLQLCEQAGPAGYGAAKMAREIAEEYRAELAARAARRMS